jgi:hypothetical protein
VVVNLGVETPMVVIAGLDPAIHLSEKLRPTQLLEFGA